jgi:hypothetical protein
VLDSHHSVSAATEKFQEAELAQDLHLLPNLVAHVPITRMQLRERVCVAVDIRQRKSIGSQRTHYIQNVESPTALFGVKFRKRPNARVLLSHYVLRQWGTR